MPQLILIGFAVLGGWYVWKTLKREMARVDAETREVERTSGRPSETLEYDARTGTYRPKKGDGR